MTKLIAASLIAAMISGVSIAEAKTVEAKTLGAKTVEAKTAEPHARMAVGPAEIVAGAPGKHFANAKGMTLYTFDKDRRGKSECTLLCAAAWPPMIAAADEKATGHWSLVKRANGAMQWAYNGAPLYTYRLDLKPGDVSGNGVDGEWHLAKP